MVLVTEAQVTQAQQEWGTGIVEIGKLKDTFTECESYASAFLDRLYAFETGDVLFKPTKCAVEQFRLNKARGISYFIAGENRECKEDKGFALAPWTKVRFENAGVILEDNRAIAMGNYFFTDVEGNEAKVEYTFGYKLVNGALKIDNRIS